MKVVSASAWIGSFKACLMAVKALQYCFLDLDATWGAWETLDIAAMPTASITARNTWLGLFSK